MTTAAALTTTRRTVARCLLLLAVLSAPAARAAEVLVSAATSLTNAMREIGRQFEAVHPGERIAFNFAASDVLLAQIQKGAPVDVFASADEETMDRAERAGALMRNTRRDFAANRLVIVVPRDARPIASSRELASDRVRRIAIGSPDTVPAGRYARDALRAAGVWDAVQARLVLAQNVRQVLDYVARG